MPSSKDKNQNPLVPPGAPPGDRLRKVASALAQYAPLGGLIITLTDDVLPTGAERQRKAWEGDVSERINDHTVRLNEHDALLQPQEQLEGTTVALVVALANDCPNGMGRKDYDLDALVALCPDLPRQELADAVYDLKALGLVHKTDFIGRHWHIRLTERFYEQVDHQVMGWETDKDAVQIAMLMLEHKQGRASKLHELTGWSARRFNPAWRQVLDVLPPGRVSNEIQPHYVASFISLIDEDRATLRRFIKARSA